MKAFPSNFPPAPILPHPNLSRSRNLLGTPTRSSPPFGHHLSMCWQREQQTGRSVAEGSSPVRCRFCNRAFPFRSFLLRHERKHTGERPFKCSVCGKSFALKHHLTTHMRTHALHNALQPPGSGTQPTGRTGTLTVEPSLQQQ